MAITVVGLDPSLRNLGMAKGQLCLDTGEFKLTDLSLVSTSVDKKNKVVRKNSEDLWRARKLYTALQEFIAGIDLVCVEIPVGSQTARAMTSYGVCIGLLASVKIPMIEVTPLEVKTTTVGSKTATKKDMIDWAVKNYPYGDWLTTKQKGKINLVAKNEHLADAVASIYAGVKSEQFKQAKLFMRN